MSAADVVMAALAAIPGEQDAPEEWICEAQCILDSLKAAGYAVVELPKPNGDPEDFASGTTAAWIDLTHGDEQVSAVMGEVSVIAPSIYYSSRQARLLAAALLAAADAAEATK